MNIKIKTLIVVFVSALLGFTSCKEDTYSLGDLSGPTNLIVNADVVGKTADLPNGDGSGVVNFTFSANNAISYKVDFGDGSAPKIFPASESKKYNKVGTHHYRINVTAIGKGGTATTSIIELDVYYAYNVNPVTVTLLTGDSPTGKTWAVDSDMPAHLGLGPGPNRPDGNAETFEPTWWQATPNSRSTKGVYNDRYTFTNTKEFTNQTGGDLYGYKTFFARDYDPATPGAYGGFGDEWILSYPDFTESFDYDGDDDGTEYITFEKLGYCGFFNGSHKMMILELTENTMWLRAAETSGTNTAAWYVKLKVVDN